MVITRLSVGNYKSLGQVTLTPEPLTVVVGSNASGKTNLADCLEFVSEVYQHGLEVAVARKGGYENIAHRKERRSKKAVSIELVAQYALEQAIGPTRRSHTDVSVVAKHAFSFKTHGSSIAAEFEVVSEDLEIHLRSADTLARVVTVSRTGQKIKVSASSANEIEKRFPHLENHGHFSSVRGEIIRDYATQVMTPTELLVVMVGRVFPIMRAFMNEVGGIRVFQISPVTSREFGVPTPGPELDRAGHNLPAVIDLLQKRYSAQWEKIMAGMTRVLPDLHTIDVTYSSSRTLALQFHERGIGRPWNVAELSDGTIQTLALLVALFDPRSTGLVIEEPENSVHPWIIRTLLEACTEASLTKQILITTHSPIVMNSVRPEQVVVMWRRNGSSHARPLLELDPGFKQLWETGEVATFGFLDSGALWHAIPAEPRLLDEED